MKIMILWNMLFKHLSETLYSPYYVIQIGRAVPSYVGFNYSKISYTNTEWMSILMSYACTWNFPLNLCTYLMAYVFLCKLLIYHFRNMAHMFSIQSLLEGKQICCYDVCIHSLDFVYVPWVWKINYTFFHWYSIKWAIKWICNVSCTI